MYKVYAIDGDGNKVQHTKQRISYEYVQLVAELIEFAGYKPRIEKLDDEDIIRRYLELYLNK